MQLGSPAGSGLGMRETLLFALFAEPLAGAGDLLGAADTGVADFWRLAAGVQRSELDLNASTLVSCRCLALHEKLSTQAYAVLALGCACSDLRLVPGVVEGDTSLHSTRSAGHSCNTLGYEYLCAP